MFTPLTGRTVLVTGGTKGIGKGIAGVFAAPGRNVVLSGRGEAAGEAAVRDLSGRGGKVSYVQGDVASAADCERVAAEVASRHGGIDVLCANAGVFPDTQARRHDRGRHRRDLRDQRQGHDADREGVHPVPRGLRPRPRDPDELDHRPDHRLSGLVALRRDQGGPARLPAHGLHRARAEEDHRERGAARQRRVGGHGRARAGVPRLDGGVDPARPARLSVGDRCGGPVPGDRRGRIHHRPDHRRRRRPGRARVAGGAPGRS